MGVPILNEIWNGVRTAISTFFTVMPGWFKFIFFLLFVGFVASWLMPFFLGVMGFECASTGTAYKVDIVEYTLFSAQYSRVYDHCAKYVLNITSPSDDAQGSSIIGGFFDWFLNIGGKALDKFQELISPVNEGKLTVSECNDIISWGNSSSFDIDKVLPHLGEPMPSIDETFGVSVVCIDRNNRKSASIGFFNIDMFDWKLWTLILFITMTLTLIKVNKDVHN